MFILRALSQDIVISNELKYYMRHKNLQEGDRLPSERELSEYLGVQRLTTRSALKVLLQEGWIIAKERSGYYVAKPRLEKKSNQIESSSFKLSSMGFDLKIQLLEQEKIEVNKVLSDKMRLPLGTRLHYIKRLRLIDQEPISIEKSYIPIEIAPNLDEYDLEHDSLYRTLIEQFHMILSHAQQDIIVKEADEMECKLLQLATGSTVVQQQGLVYSEFPIEYSECVMDKSRFIYRY